MKALVGAFNQEKALVGAFSVIVQLHRLIDLRHYTWHSRGSCSSPSPSSLSPETELMWSLRRCLQVSTVASSPVVFWQSLRSNDLTFECSKYFNYSPFNPLFKKILLRMSFKFEGNVANFSNRIGLLLSVSLLTDKFIREGIRQWVIFFQCW